MKHAKEIRVEAKWKKVVSVCPEKGVTVGMYVRSSSQRVIRREACRRQWPSSGCPVMMVMILTGVEGILLGQQRLHRGQVAAELVGAHVRLLVRYPGLDHVGLPQQLEVRRVVDQSSLAARR